MMQSAEDHQESPNEDAAVMPVGEPRKRRRVQNLAVESCQKRKDGSRRKSAASCRKMSCQWHGKKGTSLEKFRSRQTVNCGGNLPLPAEGQPTTQKWYSRRNEVIRTVGRTRMIEGADQE
jgi:hypothetical protein